MDARKLVGMTQGARKRRARWDSDNISLPWRRAVSRERLAQNETRVAAMRLNLSTPEGSTNV